MSFSEHCCCSGICFKGVGLCGSLSSLKQRTVSPFFWKAETILHCYALALSCSLGTWFSSVWPLGLCRLPASWSISFMCPRVYAPGTLLWYNLALRMCAITAQHSSSKQIPTIPVAVRAAQEVAGCTSCNTIYCMKTLCAVLGGHFSVSAFIQPKQFFFLR